MSGLHLLPCLFPAPRIFALTLLLLSIGEASAQPQRLVSCKPASERTGAEGCWILASDPLGKLPDGPIYWTLDVYPTRDGAERSKTEHGTVVEALGRIWVLSVGGNVTAPAQGHRMTQIGPLPVRVGEEYTAQYMEAILQPGSVSRTHVHAGPEAFYTEQGESCLETPSGKQVGREGTDVVVPEGEPMELVATGKEVRRGLVLVLHSSSKPATTVVGNWVSKGLCKKAD